MIANASGLCVSGSFTFTSVNAESVVASEYRSSNTGMSRTVTWLPGSWLSASAAIPRVVASCEMRICVVFVRFSMSATPAAVLRVETRNKVHPDLSTPTAVVKYVIVSIRAVCSQYVSLDVSYTPRQIRVRWERALTSTRKNRHRGLVGSGLGGTFPRVEAGHNVACGALHGAVSSNIGDELDLVAVLIGEKRVVRVLLRVPSVEIRNRRALLYQVKRTTKFRRDVGGDVGRSERHVRCL